MNRLTEAWQVLTGKAAKRPKPGADEREWNAATVRLNESVRWDQTTRQDFTALVARIWSDAHKWAMLNSGVCASQILRLYRAAGADTMPARARAIPKRRMKYLTSGRAGTKCVQWAELAGDAEEVTDAPVLDLLTRPNQHWTGRELFQLSFYEREITGNSFWEAAYANAGLNGNVPVALLPMYAQWVTVRPSKAVFIAEYVYGRERTDLVRLPPEQVLHVKFAPHPTEPYIGVGPMHSVLAELDLLRADLVHDLDFVKNGKRPDWALIVPPDMPSDSVTTLQAMIRKALKGIRKHGDFLTLQGADLKQVQWTPRDLQTTEKHARLSRSVRQAFGIPESMADVNDANLASSKVGYSSQYLATTIRPRIIAMAEALTEQLLPMFGVEPGEMWFAYDDPVPDEERKWHDIAIRAWDAALLTRNEARTELGFDPVDEDGDDFKQPPQPSLSPFGGGARPDEERKLKHPAFADDHNHKAADVPPPDPRLMNELARLYAGLLPEVAGLTNPEAVNLAGFRAQVQQILFSELGRIWLEGANGARGADGSVLASFGSLPTWAEDYLNNYTVRLADEIAASMEVGIREAIRSGIQAGEGQEGIRQRVSAAIGEESGFRSERIARTESSYVQVRGQLGAFQEAGFTRKRWILSSAPCPLCLEVAARNPAAIPMEQRFFEPEWGDGMGPPRHPNCNCAVIPVRE